MRTSLSVGASAAAAAVLTHGLVLAGLRFDDPSPGFTYQGFFRHIVSATERLWSFAHGWQPMSHIRDFGPFYAPAVQLICPLIGFALCWILSQHKVGIQLWKPLAIALLLAKPYGYVEVMPGYATPWVEAARTTLVILLMVWSVGALRRSATHTAAAFTRRARAATAG